jgi:hypothetical protein
MNGKNARFVELALPKSEYALAEVYVMIFQDEDLADPHSGHSQQAKQRAVRARPKAIPRFENGRRLNQA